MDGHGQDTDTDGWTDTDTNRRTDERTRTNGWTDTDTSKRTGTDTDGDTARH